jgi:5-formyltetrahydrofolate cyclo-ligase
MPVFEPTKMAEYAQAAKLELRKRLRGLRAAYPAEALRLRSEAIVSRVAELPAFSTARSVALFFPLEQRKEVDLRKLDERARALGKLVYYPFLERRGDRLITGLRLTSGLDDLEQRDQPFFEPPLEAAVAVRGDVDLVFVPALGVAPTGHRLGYGAGFYDATLPDFCPPAKAVGVAYDFQLLMELPTLTHDVPCHAVVTDAHAFFPGMSEA